MMSAIRHTVSLWLALTTLGSAVVFGQPAASSSTTLEIPTSRTLSRYGLELAWWSQALMNPRRDKLKFIVVDEDNVYLQATNGIMTAFNADTGKRLWAVQLGNRDEPVFLATTNQTHVLAAHSMTLYCIERFTGKIAWELQMPTIPSVGPTVDDDHVYIGSIDGSVYSYELRKINELKKKNLPPSWSFQARRWRYRTAKEITTPVYSNGVLVNFASRDNSLYAVSASERKLRYQFETTAPIAAPFAVAGDSLVLVSEDNYVYCLNSNNGTILWENASGFPIRKAPRIIGNEVFVAPERGGIFSMNLKTGTDRWIRGSVTNFLAATKDRVFATDTTGNVAILGRQDGRPLGTLALRPYSVRLENERTDRLFLATPSGVVLCVKEAGSEFAKYYKFPERTPLVPEIEPDEMPGQN